VDAEVDATSIRIESEEEAWFVDRLVVVAGQEELVGRRKPLVLC